ncbi:ABC transporter ATP-binding protein [Planococcus donghaensis MPA1U2]|uniref:ABC transporter ATP-binding protein n=1 Tax=Planococcus donghaensis MPA1U2 TaxID=933115 RepID=E7RCN7_9BACL|nr:ABC transporter ATP-binding protein [Planococcus donghaensis]EGA91402.1 ABC transporter ATP-binding protein [Planococcus donghaensis MPA1U2]
MLHVSNLTKKINNQTLVDDLSFSIGRGRVLGILGPNGAGKTTTMRMILGLVSKKNGSITINNKSLDTEFERALMGVGAIIEAPKFYPHLSGIQNLKYFNSLDTNSDNNRITEVLELLGLLKDGRKKVKYYSLGMKQKLGIALATLNQPSLLILDEPFNGLDPHSLRVVRRYLKGLASKGTSILISSHIISEIELICDDIMVMNKGKLVGDFKVNELSFTASYVLVSIVVDDLSWAASVISSQFNLVCCIEKESVQIKTNETSIPNILKELLNEGINVYEAIQKRSSVEEKFMEITGGGVIA